jgi:hypothetical protein
MTNIETNSELDTAAEEFFQAAYKYRQALKRHAPKEDGGVIWVRRGNEIVAYSHMGRYTQQICELTYDMAKDSLLFTEPVHPDDSDGYGYGYSK